MRVAELFVSLQGEGASIGLPTAFVRLAGCNLRCAWCDTPQAWEGGGEVEYGTLLEWARSSPARRFCITGGEPLLQPDAVRFVRELSSGGARVEVETNGSQAIDGLLDSEVVVNMDYKLPSSGCEGEMRLANLPLLREGDQLKFVIADKVDFDRAVAVLREHTPKARVCMTAVGGVDMRWLADAILRSGLDIRLYPQLHKLIWGDRSGV